MTKTIEEAAREFAKNRVGDYDYLGNEYEAYLDGSNDTVEWLFSLPLSQRLTDEEREKVRKEYMQAIKDWIGVGDARGYSKTCIALESIFSKELFGEDEG